MKVLDVSRMKQALDGWAPPTDLQGGPGQDDRLVPGQQGPGGREMVNRRRWFRRDMPPRASAGRAPQPARRCRRLDRHRSRPAIRAHPPHGRRSRALPSDRRQADPVHQPVLLARPRLDGPAPDRPGRVAGGRRATSATSCASQGRYKPGEPRPPAYEIHEGVHIHRVPATSLGRRGTWARMTDYLSFYAGAIVKALLLPRFDVGRHAHDAADHRPDRHALEAARGDAARLLEHGPPSRRQPGAWADVAARASSRGSCAG